MTQLDPIIAAKDVEASASWYQRIFGFKSLHGGDNFAVMATEDEEIVFCIHKWGEHEHPSLTGPGQSVGNGLLLYFRTSAMDRIRKNVEEAGCLVTEEVHLNMNSRRREFSLRDPDGYYLTVSEFHVYEG